MVRAIDKYKEYFKDFEGNYVIIGGTAYEIHEKNNAFISRATKDIDIILIIEALSNDFVEKFWQFIKEGDHRERNKGIIKISSLVMSPTNSTYCKCEKQDLFEMQGIH